jgi:hypothetical protein
VLAEVTPEDVLQFGLIPELVGRLPVITPLMPLDARRHGQHPDRAEERHRLSSTSTGDAVEHPRSLSELKAPTKQSA